MVRRWGLIGVVAVLLCAACPVDHHPYTAAAPVKTSHDEVAAAEQFHDETLQQINDAKAAVRAVDEALARATTTTPRASRSRTTTAPRLVPVVTGDFWRRLANCESSDGTGGNGGGFFQFSPDTARKVGYRPGQSYGVQVGLAQKWLNMIGGRGGSRSGWPVCWWKAGGH